MTERTVPIWGPFFRAISQDVWERAKNHAGTSPPSSLQALVQKAAVPLGMRAERPRRQGGRWETWAACNN